ncbi:MAG: 23S rRNA (guanosine(2251)-2'-O)-methyltransferase RlmB [Hyphomicrobiaceae bacterium]
MTARPNKPRRPHDRGNRHSRQRTKAPQGERTREDGHPERGRRPAVNIRDDACLIYGLHAAEAALLNPKRVIRRAFMSATAAKHLSSALEARGLSITPLGPVEFHQPLGPETTHQGAILDVDPLPDYSLDELCAATTPGHPLVLLDQVTDPHNVGAILRSAAVFGASGVVMTRRHSPPLSRALAKTASGALEQVRIALVPNLARALAQIGDYGIHRIGLDGAGDHQIEQSDTNQPLALVLGAEGPGLRRLTREHCDRLVRIGASGPFASLNVSNAAAVALYALSRTNGG